MSDQPHDNPYAAPWPERNAREGEQHAETEAADEDVAVDDESVAAPVARTPLQQLYLNVWDKLEQAPTAAAKGNSGVWLLITLVVFALSMTGQGVEAIALLVAVIFLHEAGHFLAMRVFGYTDVRMFFIPFFGGAATGKKHAAPGWQQAVVVLAGPLPGIALAAGLLAAHGWHQSDPNWYRNGVAMLLLVNGFNLFPVLPLDGGRLMSLLIFSRHPMLELLFRLFGVLCSGVFAWLLQSWFFALVTLQLVSTLGVIYRQAHGRRRLKLDFPDMPRGLLDLDEHMRWALVEEARYVWKTVPDEKINEPGHVGPVVNTVRQLHEETVTAAPRFLSTAFLSGVYALSVLAVPAAGMMIFLFQHAEQQDQILADHITAWERVLDESDVRIEQLERLIDKAEKTGDDEERQAALGSADKLWLQVHDDLVGAKDQADFIRLGRGPRWIQSGTPADRKALNRRLDETGLRNSNALRRVIALHKRMQALAAEDEDKVQE